ncbi:olfactory receptor 7G3-like [Equus asinus]|uniref:olfactory receptor 7G3-like n=1 Tax=Equus asinus TaxID=9793 RepID=UPI001D03AB75|nr:olfactory receptor 7G3-like [Equus asinus]
MAHCFILFFANLENFVLAAMEYEDYVAIYHPPRYMITMKFFICGLLILLSLIISIADALLHSLMVLPLSFCTDLEIPHFFCELAQVIKLFYSNTVIKNILVYLVTGIQGSGPLPGIIFSYIQIVSSILRIASTRGKYKACSTSRFDVSVVSLFYGTALGVYISSALTHSSKKTDRASMMYTMVSPMLNPFIYSLRNRDMKETLMKLI